MTLISRLVTAMLAAGALALCAAAPAGAQSSTPDSDWKFELTPYFWAAMLKGDVQAGSLPMLSLDWSFSDIFNHLDMAGMGAFEARKERWGFLFDGIYMKLSDTATASRTGTGPIGVTAIVNADATLKATILSGGVAYRVLEGTTPVDVLGGVRYTKIELDADIGIGLFGPIGLNPNATVSRSGQKSWYTPYIGVRVVHPVADRWTLTGYGDIAGSGSNSGWQYAAGAAYAYSKDVSFKFGYRELRIDYDKDGLLFNVKMKGPYAAASFFF